MKVIATKTDARWYLVQEKEFVSTNEALKQIFVDWGWAREHVEPNPEPPKGVNNYEPNKSYPADRFIIKDGDIIQSNIITSTSFITSEWDIVIKGA